MKYITPHLCVSVFPQRREKYAYYPLYHSYDISMLLNRQEKYTFIFYFA